MGKGLGVILTLLRLALQAVQREMERRRNDKAQRVQDDPGSAWANRFGRVQPDADQYGGAEQLPADCASDATNQIGRHGRAED